MAPCHPWGIRQSGPTLLTEPQGPVGGLQPLREHQYGALVAEEGGLGGSEGRVQSEAGFESLLLAQLLLPLTHFSRVRLCVTPETAAHQAPPSLGFSRQEHWSGLPLPSPMHESEK